MASPARLLHLPFKDPDGTDGHVLVRVTPTSDDPSSSSSSPLNLELLATQGTEAFVLLLQHRSISKYRDHGSSCSEQDWEKYLISLLVDHHPIADLDVLAESKEKGHLTIDIRKRAPGRAKIQNLGTLRLRRSFKAAEHTDLFGWCVEQVKARGQLESEVEGLRRKHAELEKLVAEETAHFQELERGKREFEALHDSFCRDLVNEKKLKIRALEQVLSTAHVGQDDELSRATATVSSSSSSTSKRRPVTTARAGASGKGKRKAGGSDANVPSSDEETENGVEKMDVDVEAEDDMSDHDVGMTTPETASEAEPEPKQTTRTSATRKQSARASPPSTSARSSRKAVQHSKTRQDKILPASGDEDEPEPEPPRRLPVNKKPAPVLDTADDESTASE